MEGHGHSRRRRGDGCTVVECYTPTRVVSRWFSGLRSSKEKREAGEEERDDVLGGYHLAPVRCSTKRLNESKLLDEKQETHRFELQSKVAPLEKGIGSFLLYLVVASKTELDKMANLRMRMEMFLLNAKEELQKKEVHETPAMSLDQAEPTGHQFSPQVIWNLASSIFEGSSTSDLQEGYTECEVSKPEYYHQGTYRNSKLQADVASLPLCEKTEEKHMKHQNQKQCKIKDDDHMKNHIQEMVTDERYGVCPYELERKLHGLLETRQQEELRKLETALTRVERRLQEKETEVSWWKDAACLLAQRVPESSRGRLEWCNLESSTTYSQQSVPKSFKPSPTNRISFSR
ncbi:unnamed protein product [Cochlearia groenlandica]